MIKHRGFPSRMPGSDHQFTIRRANHKKGPTKVIARERFRDRKAIDRKADELFLWALIDRFGDEPFVRGNLDAGRLGWLLGREVVALDDPFDPEDYEAEFRVDMDKARITFPQIFADDAVQPDFDDDEWN